MLKKILNEIYYYLPLGFLLKPIILFESNPDFCDNSRGVYDRLIELGYNEKYKLVWFVLDKSKFNDINVKNVEFVDANDKNKMRYYQFFAKYIVDCNRYIYKRNKYQVRIHLTHGATIKYNKNYCSTCGKLDYVIQIGNYFTDYNKKFFSVSTNQVISTGFPRDDILLKKNSQVFFPDIKRKKTICWFPTYRNHKSHSTGKTMLPYGIPSVNNEDELKKLDACLKKEDILLVIKLHPAEDTSILRKLDLDHIKLVEDSIFDSDHSTVYHYLSNVDALITDYSSLYYDFMLTKKPIGMAVSDIKDYIANNTLIFNVDNYESSLPGEYIYNFKDLLTFIHNVAIDNDISYNRRMEKMKIYHKYFDDKSADRIIAIMEKKGLKK